MQDCIHTMYFLCITSCNTKYFWAAMICKLLEPFQKCCYCCIIWCELICVWMCSTCKLTGCCSGNFFSIAYYTYFPLFIMHYIYSAELLPKINV